MKTSPCHHLMNNTNIKHHPVGGSESLFLSNIDGWSPSVLAFIFCYFRYSGVLFCVFSADRLQSGMSWYFLFRQYYRDLGRYIKYYPVLKRAWEQLKNFLQQRCPRMIASLKGDAALPTACLVRSCFPCQPLSVSFVFFVRGRHRSGAQRQRGSDRLQAPGRLPLLVPHPQRAEAGHPGVGICVAVSPGAARPAV